MYIFYIIFDVLISSALPFIDMFLIKYSMDMLSNGSNYETYLYLGLGAIVLGFSLRMLRSYLNYKRDNIFYDNELLVCTNSFHGAPFFILSFSICNLVIANFNRSVSDMFLLVCNATYWFPLLSSFFFYYTITKR